MMTWLKHFVTLARGKLTTYVALAIVAVEAAADNADALLAQMPSFAALLPNAPAVTHALHYAVIALGFLAVYTRVRRLLGAPKPP